MFTTLFQAVRLTLVSIIICMVIYPLVIRGLAVAAPQGGLGQTVSLDGRVVGYSLIGQSFTQDKWFWGRPSAVGYNAAGSAGSNKATTNPDYLKDVRDRLDSFLIHNPGLKASDIPSEMITASGSGLDPDISPEAAQIQVARVARARGIPEKKLLELVKAKTRKPLWGVFGTSTVNVLDLNTSLYSLQP